MFANLETRLDRARDEGVRLTLKVGELSGKLREMRLRWFGHLAWIDDHNIGRRTWRMADGGWRMADGAWRMADGARGRGRPRKRWVDCVRECTKVANMTE